MNVAVLSELIGKTGLPSVILLYVIWRGDKFLTHLCKKLDVYNDELGNISASLGALVELLKAKEK